MSRERKEVLNIVLSDSCPDDMESWDGLISFDVDRNVLDAKEALKEAVSEFILSQRKSALSEDDVEETVTWDMVYSRMPDELFKKHGLYRRRDVVNILVFADCDDEPDFEED